MTVVLTQLVADSLATYLRRKLPAKATELNSARVARLHTGVDGPYTSVSVTAGFALDVATEGNIVIPYFGALPAVTSAQMVDILNQGYFPDNGLDVLMRAVVDGAGFYIETFATSGASDQLNVILLPRSYVETFQGVSGSWNSVFGWSEGGERVSARALVAPNWRGVCDGFPVAVPDAQQGFWIVIGDREAVPVGESSLRRDSWEVRLPLHILSPSRADEKHRTREPIALAVRAVLEVLLTADGRQLGRSALGDIQKLEVTAEEIHAQPIAFEEIRNTLYDTATIHLAVRVFQRPANS